MQIKATMCFLYTSIRMIKIKKIDNIKYGEATGTLTDGNNEMFQLPHHKCYNFRKHFDSFL